MQVKVEKNTTRIVPRDERLFVKFQNGLLYCYGNRRIFQIDRRFRILDSLPCHVGFTSNDPELFQAVLYRGRLVGFYDGVLYYLDECLPTVCLRVPEELRGAQFFTVNDRIYLYDAASGSVFEYNQNRFLRSQHSIEKDARITQSGSRVTVFTKQGCSVLIGDTFKLEFLSRSAAHQFGRFLATSSLLLDAETGLTYFLDVEKYISEHLVVGSRGFEFTDLPTPLFKYMLRARVPPCHRLFIRKAAGQILCNGGHFLYRCSGDFIIEHMKEVLGLSGPGFSSLEPHFACDAQTAVFQGAVYRVDGDYPVEVRRFSRDPRCAWAVCNAGILCIDAQQNAFLYNQEANSLERACTFVPCERMESLGCTTVIQLRENAVPGFQEGLYQVCFLTGKQTLLTYKLKYLGAMRLAAGAMLGFFGRCAVDLSCGEVLKS